MNRSRLGLAAVLACLFAVAAAEAALRVYGFGRGIRYRPHTALGWEMLPGQHAFNIRGRATVRTNSFGFRGPEISAPRPDSLGRILFLGDGSTLANQFAEEHTYPFRVRDGLDGRCDVAVGAVSGYQLEQHLELLLRHGAEIDPTTIVVGFCWNDWAPSTMRGPGLGPAAFAEYGGEPRVWRRTAIADFATRLQRIRRRTSQSRAYARGERLPDAAEDEAVWAHVSTTLDSIVAWAERRGTAVVLLVVPARMAEHDRERFAPRKQRLADWAAARGVRFADPESAYAAAAPRGAALHLDELHPGPDAHPILAAQVLDALRGSHP